MRDNSNVAQCNATGHDGVSMLRKLKIIAYDIAKVCRAIDVSTYICAKTYLRNQRNTQTTHVHIAAT